MTTHAARIQARALLSITALALVATALLPAPVRSGATFKRGTLTILQGKVRVTVNVEVADTPESRAQGLMNRPSLEDNAGMLFVFESTERWSFWMKNTLIPLSVAFIDNGWEIVDIKDMPVAPNPQTGPFDFYDSAKPSRYALEVNQGFFTRRGLGIGAKVMATINK